MLIAATADFLVVSNKEDAWKTCAKNQMRKAGTCNSAKLAGATLLYCMSGYLLNSMIDTIGMCASFNFSKKCEVSLHVKGSTRLEEKALGSNPSSGIYSKVSVD